VVPDAVARRLSQLDAFFVAYQEHAGIPMQIGIETDLRGQVTRGDLLRMVEHLARWWPPLAQCAQRRAFGLAWAGEPQVQRMVAEASDPGCITAWRNHLIDPFVEPPCQVLSVRRPEGTTLALRAHHAVADGGSAQALASEALLALAAIRGGSVPASPAIAARRHLGGLLRPRHLRALWRAGPPRPDAGVGRSARLWVRETVPGESGTVERVLESDEYGALRTRAGAWGTTAPWLCAAAWMRAMYAWNGSHGGDRPSLMSLEVPVRLHRARHRGTAVGNHISPVIVFGDAAQRLDQVARSLRQQMAGAVHDGRHLALPVFTAPARYLPWGLFRRLAVRTSATGQATSHFAWLSQPRDLAAEMAHLSRDRLELGHQTIYTPVCLHMGAALAVVAWRGRLQLFITYRTTALTRRDAEALGELLVGELARSTARGEAQLA
jgi:hypothetical protein